jgi:KUP system potassium uptake protein
VVARTRWGWGFIGAATLTAVLLAVDLSYFASNALKIADGGWVPLVVGAALFVLMTTWRRGRAILGDRIRDRSMPVNELPAWLAERNPVHVHGAAVYLTAQPDAAPVSLVENVTHNHSIHEQVVLLSLVVEQSARVGVAHRLEVERIDDHLMRLTGHYGFVERPDVPSLIELAIAEGVDIDAESVTYVLGRETLLASDRPGMALWREALFAFMSRNAQRAAAFFGIPSDKVLEIGAQIEL